MLSFQINPLESPASILHLKKQWLATLTAAQDGMWESFRDQAQHWAILSNDALIGYACTNDQKQIIQYFNQTSSVLEHQSIFKHLMEKTSCSVGIVGTNNPIFHSTALHFADQIEIHTYLFRETVSAEVSSKPGKLRAAQTRDLQRIVDFCNLSVGAPKEWLNGYVSNLINQQEIYTLENHENIIGTCEVRNSSTNETVADIGMIVSPNYRKQGYGTYLLQQAKQIAEQNGKTPICSCEKGNIGSLKSIERSGLRSTQVLLNMQFKER